MDFSSLWHEIFKKIPLVKEFIPVGFAASPETVIRTLDDYLPSVIKPGDIVNILQQLSQKIIIVVDEIDRLTDQTTTMLLADTIKSLSDHAIDTTLILVGVADSVDNLIAEHRSVERALVQIRMPRMSETELLEIIDKGLATVDMKIEAHAREKIANLSQGLPHYTHLLALHSAQEAASKKETLISYEHVKEAIDKALKKAQQSIINAYHTAVSSSRENMYSQVLLACAMATPDELGYFSASDIRAPLSRVMNRQYEIAAFSQHLNAFCEQHRGPILQKTGLPRKFRFRFINPLIQPYILMEGIKQGLISDDIFNPSPASPPQPVTQSP
jgi:hypothetical protein